MLFPEEGEQDFKEMSVEDTKVKNITEMRIRAGTKSDDKITIDELMTALVRVARAEHADIEELRKAYKSGLLVAIALYNKSKLRKSFLRALLYENNDMHYYLRRQHLYRHVHHGGLSSNWVMRNWDAIVRRYFRPVEEQFIEQTFVITKDWQHNFNEGEFNQLIKETDRKTMQRTADALMGVLKEQPPLRSNTGYLISSLYRGGVNLALNLTANDRCQRAWKKTQNK